MLGGSNLSNHSSSHTSTALACGRYSWPGFLCPATYHKHVVHLLLDIMYSCTLLASHCSIGITNATISPVFWTNFFFSSLHIMRQGVDLFIGGSSINVVSEGSSFTFICFFNRGITPPIPAVPVHYGLDISVLRSALLPASWLVPVISF